MNLFKVKKEAYVSYGGNCFVICFFEETKCVFITISGDAATISGMQQQSAGMQQQSAGMKQQSVGMQQQSAGMQQKSAGMHPMMYLTQDSINKGLALLII